MITLGIETSCDETSIAFLKNGKKILANVTASSVDEHRRFGGVVPEIAHRAHLETILPCLERAQRTAGVGLQSIDLIAVTQGPGLMGSLLVGLSAAKSLSLALQIPLIGVDHVLAHAYAALLSHKNLQFPYLALIVSGGHTLIIHMKTPGDFKVLGRTIDDAAGEAFDKVAKILGLRYPGGPEIDRLSQDQDTTRIKFSRPFLSKDSLDFSFSGIKTAVFYKTREIKNKRLLTLSVKRQVCAGFQEAVCDVLVEKSLRAAQTHKLRTLVVGGGVSANSRLRHKLVAAASVRGLKVFFPSHELCQDNAAMVAALGTALYREGKRSDLGLSSYSEFRY